MLNKLTDTRLFMKTNEKTHYITKMGKIDWNNFKIDKEFYEFRLGNIKSYKYPLIKEITNAVENGTLIQCAFNHSTSMKGPQDLFEEKIVPKSLYNIPISGPKGFQILTNLSTKGKYITDKSGEITTFDVPDLAMYFFNLSSYVSYLCLTTNLTAKHRFFMLIAEAYSLLLTRVIDRNYPIAINGYDNDKMAILTCCFCLESMFGLEKREAIEYSLKLKMVANKNVVSQLRYAKSNITMKSDCDYKDRFPIDNLCDILKAEFDYIPAEKFNSTILISYYVSMFYDNAGYALENGQSFINMLIISMARLRVYDDYKINKFLEIVHKDFLKELGKVLTEK